ncbi:MAG: hypothetical protein Q9164_007170 [Protoblastenia rupestris]
MLKSPPSPSSNPDPVPIPSPTTSALEGVTKDGAEVIVEGIDVDVVADVDADTDAGEPTLEDSPVVFLILSPFHTRRSHNTTVFCEKLVIDPEEPEAVDVAKAFEGEEAGAAPEEPDVRVSMELKFDDEDPSVLVGLNTPLYVVDTEEEEDDRHTSDEDEQQGIVVLVELVEFVENAPP